MEETRKDIQTLNHLGSQTEYYFDYDKGLLEAFDNVNKQNDYLISLEAYEFSTLCPKTKQPDFAKLYINYIPNDLIVESKSLKLYLFSFRNHGDFHEDVINKIVKDLVQLLKPKYLEVLGVFAPRGGISIYPFVNYANEDYKEYKIKRIFEVADMRNSNRAIKYND